MPKPGCGLESECGTEKKIFCVLTRTFGAPRISNPGIYGHLPGVYTAFIGKAVRGGGGGGVILMSIYMCV